MVDGNEIWEALFGILEGNVPKKMNESVCAQLAEAINSVNAATPTPPTLSEDLREALERVLPYAETEAAKQPTTDGRTKRMLQARKDAAFARTALAQVKAS